MPPPPAPGPFAFPREYHFPPFFTRQTNLTTHHAQLTKWAALVLAYCRHHRIYRLSLSSAAAAAAGPASALPAAPARGENYYYDNDDSDAPPPSPSAAPASASAPAPAGGATTGTAEELFHNRRLNRRLAPADVREVIDFMRKDGRAEYVGREKDAGAGATGGGGGGGGGDVVWIHWRKPDEWAALIEAWVDETAQKGTVLTLYELVEGDGTLGTEIHGMDADLLQKALLVLVKRGRAQIFGQEDSQGVKFF
ncbi:hypothetical protein RB595_002408 [Gaeumannomyces hyphopodioides]